MRVHDSSVLRVEAGSSSLRPWKMAVVSSAPGKVDVQIEGTLDLTGARRVIEVLAHADVAAIYIDLSSARWVEDGALAHLSEALRRSTARVTFRGLGRHHQRLLQLLGREQMLDAANR